MGRPTELTGVLVSGVCMENPVTEAGSRNQNCFLSVPFHFSDCSTHPLAKFNGTCNTLPMGNDV